MKDHYESGDRREQRQQPRFNRREFLAAQQVNQEVPPTISTEDGITYRTQAEHPTRPTREDRPQRGQRDPDMSIGEFKERLKAIKWIFSTPSSEQSFYGVLESMEAQIKLYNMARRLSPHHLRAFAHAQENAFKEAQQAALRSFRQNQLEVFNSLSRTGDAELDSFRANCQQHDWTWRSSDDADHLRDAEAVEAALKAIAVEKGGLYQAYINICMTHFLG